MLHPAFIDKLYGCVFVHSHEFEFEFDLPFATGATNNFKVLLLRA